MKTITCMVIALLGAIGGRAQISITSPTFTYLETFTQPEVPVGWSFFETGDNADTNFGVGPGSNATGNTYLLGTPSEYCFGGLQSGSLVPTVGVCFVNNMPTRFITSITVEFIAETWRVGSSNRPDGLDFQINTQTNDIRTADGWTTLPQLAYRNPGQQTGSNTVRHSQSFVYTITGLSIPPGTSFCMRWLDVDASGADDAIGIDNFRVSGLASLPVELLFFSGKKEGASVLLSFATATETNNAFFVIERSADGRTFREIGQVHGAGNSQERQDYHFTDEKPLNGANFYRLRQVDVDGAASLGPLIRVAFHPGSHITLAPSPATRFLRIHLEEPLNSGGSWQVFDSMGAKALSGAWDPESADYELDVSQLPEGVFTFYLLADGQVWAKQFGKRE